MRHRVSLALLVLLAAAMSVAIPPPADNALAGSDAAMAVAKEATSQSQEVAVIPVAMAGIAQEGICEAYPSQFNKSGSTESATSGQEWLAQAESLGRVGANGSVDAVADAVTAAIGVSRSKAEEPRANAYAVAQGSIYKGEAPSGMSDKAHGQLPIALKGYMVDDTKAGLSWRSGLNDLAGGASAVAEEISAYTARTGGTAVSSEHSMLAGGADSAKTGNTTTADLTATKSGRIRTS